MDSLLSSSWHLPLTLMLILFVIGRITLLLLHSWINIDNVGSNNIFLFAKGHEELDAASLREHEEFTKVKNIATIELGRYEIETWYFSPFPAEYNDCLKLYFCEFCLNFMKRKEQLQRHMVRCAWNFAMLCCSMVYIAVAHLNLKLSVARLLRDSACHSVVYFLLLFL